MKIYFPDDPIRQEMLESLVDDLMFECTATFYSLESVLNNGDYRYQYKIGLIEKATGEKIEEVLK